MLCDMNYSHSKMNQNFITLFTSFTLYLPEGGAQSPQALGKHLRVAQCKIQGAEVQTHSVDCSLCDLGLPAALSSTAPGLGYGDDHTCSLGPQEDSVSESDAFMQW